MYRKSSFSPSTPSYSKKPKASPKNKPIIIAMIMTIFLLIVVIVVMMFLPKGKNGNSDQSISYTVGQSVRQVGDIFSTGNRNFYYELDFDSKIFGLKSNTIDLSVYTGTVQISGTVQDVVDNMPVILVDQVLSMGEDGSENYSGDIANLSGDEQVTGDNIITQKKYFFGQYGLYVDFSSFSGYVAKQSGSTITIEQLGSGDEQSKKIFTISPYECIAGDSTKDCEQQLSNAGNGRLITNSQGVKLYNLSESNSWVFFNDGLWGYKISVSNEDEFTKLSKAINIFSQDKIKTQIKSIARQTCKNTSLSMNSVTNIDVKSEKSTLYAYVTGTDTKLNEIDCKLKLTLGEQVTAKLVTVTNAGSTTPTKDSVTATSGSKMDEVNSDSSTTSDSSFTEPTDMLKLESKMGYTAYFPKTLTFKQVGVEDLGLSGISCVSKVNAIYYKEKDNLESSPSVEVFACKTKLGESEINTLISGKGLIYKKSQATDYIFLIKSTDAGSSYASQIIFK